MIQSMKILANDVVVPEEMSARAEHLYIGVSVGYTLSIAIKTLIGNSFNPLISGEIIYLIPILLGLLMYSRFSSKYCHIYLWPASIVLAYGAMFRARGMIELEVINGMKATILPLLIPNDFKASLDNLLIFIGVITSSYMFVASKRFSIRQGAGKYIRRIGQFFIMLGLGAMFGNTIMFRMGLLLGQVKQILRVMIIPY